MPIGPAVQNTRSSQCIVVGIDQGTTNTKAMAVDERGRVLAETSRPIASAAPRPGWMEQDPEAMVANVVACLREVLERAGPARLVGIGIANQTETLVVWDRRTAKPAHPAIVWQCRRGAEEVAPLRTPGNLALVRGRTGLDIDPTFTAAKLKWLLANRPHIADGLRQGDLLWGTVDTWLVWSLTGGRTYATDAGNASRTMLFDIDRLRWDEELYGLFALSLPARPECRPSCGGFGMTDASRAGIEAPVTSVLGDQQAALFGHGCVGEMQAKVTYGTGAFLWANAGHTPREAPQGILRTIAWQTDRPTYAFEGFVMYAGKVLEWLGARLAIAGGAAGVAAEAEKAGTSAGVTLVPAFQGLASPWWKPEARAALLGLAEATSVGHVAHAGMEAVAFQVRAVLETILPDREDGLPPIRVDGGMTRSRYFTQLQADVLGRPLVRSGMDATPYGASLMAGLGAGLWADTEGLPAPAGGEERFDPDPAATAGWNPRYENWRSAVEGLARSAGQTRAVS